MIASSRIKVAGFGLVGALVLTQGAFAATDVPAKRAELHKMCSDALATLYKAKPEVKAAIAKSAGYGCFTSFGMSFFVGGAGGSGLVHSTATKHDTFMKMAQVSGGLDFGVKDYREVLVFKDAKVMAQFIDKGWQFGGAGAAVAAADGKGGKVEENAMSNESIEVYPMTKTGLAVGIAAAQRKYWKDDDLNGAMKK